MTQGRQKEGTDIILEYCVEGDMGGSVGRPSYVGVGAGETPAQGVHLVLMTSGRQSTGMADCVGLGSGVQ